MQNTYGYLIVKKAKKTYMKKTMITLVEAKIELASTAARLSGARGRNQAAWFLTPQQALELPDNATSAWLDEHAIRLK